MQPGQLEEQIRQGSAPLIIDVRSGWEYSKGHLEGAINVPYWRPLRAKCVADKSVRGVLLYCEHGPRAWLSGVLLRMAGVEGVSLLDGHMMRWKAERRPLSGS